MQGDISMKKPSFSSKMHLALQKHRGKYIEVKPQRTQNKWLFDRTTIHCYNITLQTIMNFSSTKDAMKLQNHLREK